MKNNITRHFFVTFGKKYRHEPHPQGGHPDGWFDIIAHDLKEASKMMWDYCGEHWAFIYDEKAFDAAMFPQGCLQTLIGNYVIRPHPNSRLLYVYEVKTKAARATFVHRRDCIEWAEASAAETLAHQNIPPREH